MTTMTDEMNSISRRNVLAGLGTIGVGGALVGAGTGAFFSDKETFKDNRLVAGALDLKVDWQEHYSDWSDDELDDGDDGELDITMEDPSDDSYVGFPTQAEEYLLWVHESDVDQFMMNTAIEAFPDTNNDGIQDLPSGWTNPDSDNYFCNVAADIPNVLESSWRTNNTIGGEPNPQTTNPGDPLINISDVKPGDFGELTLSFHLCDNPGYVWLTGKLRDAAENGLTEPEEKDPDEMEGVVELLDEILVQFWLDNSDEGDAEPGDNIYQDEEPLLFPEPLTLREALALLENSNDGLGIPIGPEMDSTGNGGILTPGICPEEPYDSVENSQDVFSDGTNRQRVNPFCSDFGLVEALRVESEDLPDEGTETYTTPYGDIQITTSDTGTITSWETDATPDGELDDEDGFCVSKVIVKGGQPSAGSANIYSYDADSDGSSGDEGMFTTPSEQDISNVKFCVDLREQPNGDGGRECYENSTTQYVGFSWWLPVDHANEIQTDSVEFDIGFYTEQCRHNDGTGMRESPIGVEGQKDE